MRRAGADVLFAPGYTGPLRSPVPMVVAIHDVSFAAHPEWFSWREGLRRRVLTRLTAQRAARVLTISEFSKREIVRHFGVDASKIAVTYPGVTSMAGCGASLRIASRWCSTSARSSIAATCPSSSRDSRSVARRHPDARLEIVGDNRTTPRLDLDGMSRDVRERASGSGFGPT